MTIKQILASLGIVNIDQEVQLPEESTTPITPSAPEQQNNSSSNEQQTPETQVTEQTDDPRIAAMQKEIAELKAANARLLTQTPVEHQQTADEALLDLLGIGGKDGTTEG